jgi:ribose transport system permease protein
MMTIRRLVSGRVATSYGPAVVLLIGTVLFMSLWAPGFATEASIFAVLDNLPLLGLIALGVGTTMIAGEIDASVGSVASVAAIISVYCYRAGLIPVILLCLVAGAIFGAIQGALISFLSLNSVMFTVGTMIMVNGIGYVITNSTTIQMASFGVSNELLNTLGVLNWAGVIALVVFVLVGLYLTYCRGGRYLYALGGGRAQARASGISVTRGFIMAFGISAACASLAGCLAGIGGGSAAPGDFSTVLLPGVAAAIVGGVSLSGGRGTVLNIFLGVCVFGTISAAVVVKGTNGSVALVIQGCMLLVVLVIEFGVGRFEALRSWRSALKPPREALVTSDGR